jgi:hypothetical protein
MSIQFKPDKKTEERYDEEAEQLVKYISGKSSKGEEDKFWNPGNEKFAEIASLPLMKLIEKEWAKQGEQ